LIKTPVKIYTQKIDAGGVFLMFEILVALTKIQRTRKTNRREN
jgi:hypothetical protein